MEENKFVRVTAYVMAWILFAIAVAFLVVLLHAFAGWLA